MESWVLQSTPNANIFPKRCWNLSSGLVVLYICGIAPISTALRRSRSRHRSLQRPLRGSQWWSRLLILFKSKWIATPNLFNQFKSVQISSKQRPNLFNQFKLVCSTLPFIPFRTNAWKACFKTIRPENSFVVNYQSFSSPKILKNHKIPVLKLLKMTSTLKRSKQKQLKPPSFGLRAGLQVVASGSGTAQRIFRKMCNGDLGLSKRLQYVWTRIYNKLVDESILVTNLKLSIPVVWTLIGNISSRWSCCSQTIDRWWLLVPFEYGFGFFLCKPWGTVFSKESSLASYRLQCFISAKLFSVKCKMVVYFQMNQLFWGPKLIQGGAATIAPSSLSWFDYTASQMECYGRGMFLATCGIALAMRSSFDGFMTLWMRLNFVVLSTGNDVQIWTSSKNWRMKSL